MDTARAEAEFLEYAKSSEANDEFDQLIGLAGKKEAAAPQPTENRIPEA
jgi:hypothetical protein